MDSSAHPTNLAPSFVISSSRSERRPQPVSSFPASALTHQSVCAECCYQRRDSRGCALRSRLRRLWFCRPTHFTSPTLYSVTFIALLISDSPDGAESDRCTSRSVQTNPASACDPACARTRRRDSRCSDHTRTSRTFTSRHLPRRNPPIAGVSNLPFNACRSAREIS